MIEKDIHQLCEMQSRKRYQNNGFKLLAIQRVINSKGIYPEIALAIDVLKKITGEKVIFTIESSGLHAWLMLMDALVTGNQTWFSQAYKNWLNLSQDDYERQLIAYIVKISQAHTNGLQYFQNNTDKQFNEGPFSFDGLGYALEPGYDCSERKLFGEALGGDYFPMPKIDHGLYVNNWSPSLLANFKGMETMERLNDPGEIIDFSKTLREAIQLIKAYSELRYKEIQSLLREIVVCKSSKPYTFPSGSCTLTPVAVYLTATSNCEMAAELLIHELGHIKFSIWDAENPILGDMEHALKWDDEAWYSPWRDEPRSLMGILHAMYVFVDVAEFHAHRIKTVSSDKEFSIRRFNTIVLQLKKAYEVNQFRHFLNKNGLVLFDELYKKIQGFTNLLNHSCISLERPLYAERHRSWDFEGLTIDKAIFSHHEWVVNKHQGVFA
jgi:hypothetical protein